jgi:hypothetical protein
MSDGRSDPTTFHCVLLFVRYFSERLLFFALLLAALRIGGPAHVFHTNHWVVCLLSHNSKTEWAHARGLSLCIISSLGHCGGVWSVECDRPLGQTFVDDSGYSSTLQSTTPFFSPLPPASRAGRSSFTDGGTHKTERIVKIRYLLGAVPLRRSLSHPQPYGQAHDSCRASLPSRPWRIGNEVDKFG